jgi:hypothetical protein
MEEWRLMAMRARKDMPNPGPGYASSEAEGAQWQYVSMLDGLLKQPDPPATPGPALTVVPPDGMAIPWPPAKAGVLTVRYRISGDDCRSAGSDMGCHLVALCPMETSSSVPVANVVFTAARLERPAPSTARPEVLELPSARCELRLYAQDHHGGAICTARGPKLPATGSVVELGTITLDTQHKDCEADPLAERMHQRGNLTLKWREIQQQQQRR